MDKGIQGRVVWFDSLVGEGVVEDVSGTKYYVHYSTIVADNDKKAAKNTKAREAASRATLNKEKNLKPNSKVEFTVYDNGYMRRVEKIRELN